MFRVPARHICPNSGRLVATKKPELGLSNKVTARFFSQFTKSGTNPPTTPKPTTNPYTNIAQRSKLGAFGVLNAGNLSYIRNPYSSKHGLKFWAREHRRYFFSFFNRDQLREKANAAPNDPVVQAQYLKVFAYYYFIRLVPYAVLGTQ